MAEFSRLPTQEELSRMLYQMQLGNRSQQDIINENLAKGSTVKPIPENIFQRMAGGAQIAKEKVNKLGNLSDIAKIIPGYTGQTQVNIPTDFNFAPKQDVYGGVTPQGMQTQQVNIDQLLKAIKPADVLGLTGAQQAYSDIGIGKAPNPMDVLDVAGLGATGLGAGKGLLGVAKATKGMPVGMSIQDVSKVGLPSPKSLTMPDVPTVEQMKQFGRTEIVPLSKAVSFQSTRNWDKFNAGKGPGDLVAGFGDKPLALRLETGEYVIYDGNHRTDLALQKGKTELPMHVIDVKSYDPAHAGRKPVPDKISADELLNMLIGEPTNPQIQSKVSGLLGEKAITKKPVNLQTLANEANKSGVKLDLYEKNGVINLSKIEVPKDARGTGIGSDVMNKIVNYADLTGSKIVLSPSKDFGASSVNRLKDFYKRFGFVENKGKSKDFSTRETMYREPSK